MIKDRIRKLKQNETVKTAALFSFSSAVLSFSNMLAGILVINWLKPDELGLWNSIYIALYYISFMQLGMFNALNREMPYYLGKGMPEFAKSLVSTTQWHTKVLSGLIFFGTIIFVGFTWYLEWFNKKELFSFANLGLVIVMQLVINFLTVTYRANKSFLKLTKINFTQALIILLSLLLVYKYGYNGYVFRFVVLSITLLAMMYVFRPYKVKSKFNLANYKLLLTTGIPLFTLAFALGITDTFNRVILLKVTNYEAVGYYYPAIAIIVAMRVFPTSISHFLYPKMSFEVGSTNDLNKIWGWVWKTLVSIVAIMLPIAIIGYFTLPYFFNWLFPEYIDSLFASRIALFSGVLSGSYIVITVFSSLKSWKELAILAVSKVLLYFGLQYYFASQIVPINGIAIGTLIADIIFFLLLLFLTWYVLVKRHKR